MFTKVLFVYPNEKKSSSLNLRVFIIQVGTHKTENSKNACKEI